MKYSKSTITNNKTGKVLNKPLITKLSEKDV